MTVKTLKVTIASIDVTQYITSGYTEDSLAFEISKAELKANQGIADVVTLTSGQAVKIWQDYDGSFTNSDLVFDGKIENFQATNYEYTITCLDQLNEAKTALVARVFLDTDTEAGKLSEIFKTLINTYAGLTADGTSVQDSGTVQKISKFICKNAYVYERCKKLADALNWRFHYDPQTSKVYFEPIRYTTNSNAIDATKWVSTPNWEEDKSELANSITVQGANIISGTHESFAGPATSVTLTYKPESMSVTVGGTLKIGGQPNDPGIDYYFDKETKKVSFSVSSSTIVVTYNYASPLPLHGTNSASIAAYGEQEKIITILDAANIEDLQTRLVNALNLYATPFLICKGDVRSTAQNNYQVGQQVSLTDPWSGQTGNYTIRKITRNLRDFRDNMEFGDKEFRLEGWLAYSVEYRVKKLEEESSKDTGVVSDLVQMTHAPYVRRKTIRSIIQRINDSFILGHPDDNGKLGRGIILDDFEGTIANWAATNCTTSEQTDV